MVVRSVELPFFFVSQFSLLAIFGPFQDRPCLADEFPLCFSVNPRHVSPNESLHFGRIATSACPLVMGCGIYAGRQDFLDYFELAFVDLR